MNLVFRQRLPVPHETVAAFFGDTRNLLRITPPWPRLSLEAPSTAVAAGAEYLLTFHLGPVRLRWRSRVVAVEPGRSFTDVSRSPLLGDWVHTHMFTPDGPGTMLRDDVTCGPPWWCAPFVRAGIHMMFLYRRRALPRVLA